MNSDCAFTFKEAFVLCTQRREIISQILIFYESDFLKFHYVAYSILLIFFSGRCFDSWNYEFTLIIIYMQKKFTCRADDIQSTGLPTSFYEPILVLNIFLFISSRKNVINLSNQNVIWKEKQDKMYFQHPPGGPIAATKKLNLRKNMNFT